MSPRRVKWRVRRFRHANDRSTQRTRRRATRGRSDTTGLKPRQWVGRYGPPRLGLLRDANRQSAAGFPAGVCVAFRRSRLVHGRVDRRRRREPL